VIKQPFPKAVKKDSKLTSDPGLINQIYTKSDSFPPSNLLLVIVCLIRGPKTEIKVMSQVKAVLYFDDQSKKVCEMRPFGFYQVVTINQKQSGKGIFSHFK